MEKITTERLIETLNWLVTDCKHKADLVHQSLGPGSQGGYSEELAEAIQLLADLRGFGEGILFAAPTLEMLQQIVDAMERTEVPRKKILQELKHATS